MSAPYTGNPLAVQSPDFAPQPGQSNIVSLPADADGNTYANFYQEMKRVSDELAYLKSGYYTRLEEPFLFPDSVALTAASPVTGYARLSAFATNGTITPNGGGTVAITPGFQGRTMQLHLNAAVASNLSFVTSSGAITALGGTTIFTLDFTIWLTTVAASSYNHFAGVSASQSWTAAAAPNALGFQLTGGVGPWNAVNSISSLAPVAISSGFNPVAGKFQRARIEFFGGLSPQGILNGSNGFTRFSLSTPGTNQLQLVLQQMGNPLGSGVYVVAGTNAQSTTVGSDFFFSQWIAQYNIAAINV